MNALAGLFLFAVFVGLMVVAAGLLMQYPVLLIPAVIGGVFLYRRYAGARREAESVREPEPDPATERKAARDEHLRGFFKQK